MSDLCFLITLEKLTLAARFRISKTLLYIIEHAFCNLNDIYDSGFVSKNWYDVKSSLEFLSSYNIIQSAKDLAVVYFVRKFLIGHQLIHTNHLVLKNEISKILVSKNESPNSSICNHKIVTRFREIHDQLLKVMDLEYHIASTTNTRLAEAKKARREEDIVRLLMLFWSFLSGDKRGPILSGQFKTDEEFLSHLDFKLANYRNYYTGLKQHANPKEVIIDTMYQVLLQTKKDASEKQHKTMKQISNRIKSYLQPDGSPDCEKLYTERMVESGMGIFCKSYDIALLFDLYATKEAFRATPKGKEREKIRKEVEMFFPEITFQ